MADNRQWNLERFLDSLILQLDKAQDTLAMKGVNRPLTYSVRDVALDLQVFPVFTGRDVLFTTPRPGDVGSSMLRLQLGSITDRQIRETTKPPPTVDDVPIAELDGIDADTQDTLRSIGVDSARDLERMEQRNVDIGKAAAQRGVDYAGLAEKLARLRRLRAQPQVKSVRLDPAPDGFVLTLEGENLALHGSAREPPSALLNQRPMRVLEASASGIRMAVAPGLLMPGANELAVALDRHTVLRATLET